MSVITIGPVTGSPEYCELNVKVTVSPTKTDPEGDRALLIDTSLPAVTVVLKVVVLLAVIGSDGVTVATLPEIVTVDVAAAAI
nr:hypothetical protein [Defluviimonas denitrificans]